MAKYFQKYKNEKLGNAIIKSHEAGMKATDISRQRVNYWIHNKIIMPRKRRAKLTRNEKNIIIKWAKNKPTNIAGAKKIQMKFNALTSKRKEKHMKKKIFVNGK